MTEIVETMQAPRVDGEKPLPRAVGGRGLLPSTWLGRPVRLAYVDVYGSGVETSGTLLDTTAFGAVFNLAGGRVVIAWDRVVMLELVDD